MLICTQKLDPSIAKQMRPHQLSAAEFLLARLNRDTGAILADEMGAWIHTHVGYSFPLIRAPHRVQGLEKA